MAVTFTVDNPVLQSLSIAIIIINIITSNDDPKPSTVILEQLPTGLIARHIKITPGTIIS